MRDAIFFLIGMAILAFLGFFVSLPFQADMTTATLIIQRGIDLLFIAIPPALPAALAIGTIYAIRRLQRRKIYCIAPTRINVAGRIKVMVFDKTGTLTEEGLEITGFRGCNNASFNEFSTTAPEKDTDISLCMASCHSSTTVNGLMIGDPLDIQMFTYSNWGAKDNANGTTELCQTGSSTYTATVIKRFEFQSDLQRMSVIVKTDKKYFAFVKGSPEKIKSLSTKRSLPKNFDEILYDYAHEGSRVIALSVAEIEEPDDDVERKQIEKDVNFLGFLIFKNKVKPETAGILQKLKDAEIRTMMATGDNGVTAISVAREIHLVNTEVPVFLGDIAERSNGEKYVVWKNFDKRPENLAVDEEESRNDDEDEGEADESYERDIERNERVRDKRAREVRSGEEEMSSEEMGDVIEEEEKKHEVE